MYMYLADLSVTFYIVGNLYGHHVCIQGLFRKGFTQNLGCTEVQENEAPRMQVCL